MARSPAAARKAPARQTRLLISTRKGLWTLASDASRNGWTLAGPQFLGHTVHHALTDPRAPRQWLAAARTGHLGPTIFRSQDNGRTWKEAVRPPAFARGSGRVVDHTFWLTPGHADDAGV
ncbi:MAG TPA: glycosyl hydrolase, partial [Casimicrobiaceae bacterium]|nr:glycosyl hydrolase [Casimicrobiaceae bacterium]